MGTKLLNYLFIKKGNTIVLFFFLGFLLIGLNIFNNYGVYWDEFSNQASGERWFQYVANVIFNGSSIREIPIGCKEYDLLHGPAFEMLLVFVQKRLLKLTDLRDIIIARHLFTFLTFYLATFFFYLLCKLIFKSRRIAILGCLFLILHPRIFSDSFYNSVDISFLSLYAISTYTLIRYIEEKTFLRAVFHAFACAVLIDIRSVGLISPLCTFIVIAIDLLGHRGKNEEIKKVIKTIFVYALLLIIFTFLFWPQLWGQGIGYFFKSLESTVKFQRHEFPQPWHYNLTWIAMTTPLLYSFYFFIGLLVFIKDLFKNPIASFPRARLALIVIFLFFVPIILPILYKTSLYGGWRHHYFIYPIFLIFSLAGFSALFKFIKIRHHGLPQKIISIAFILFIVASLIEIVWFMIKSHPHECVYANILAGKEGCRIKERLPLDYWGLSYRKALEYILKNDKRDILKVCVANAPGRLTVNILPINDRKRLVYVNDVSEADYFLTNYGYSNRWYREYRGELRQEDEYYSIKINGARIMIIYKINRRTHS